ncbi:hypothetical protein ACU686_12885 [Yinghuangia aomiensis]
MLADGSKVAAAALSGEECVICGSAAGLLVPAGARHTRGEDGGLVSWEVATCVAHITAVPMRSPVTA